MSRYHHIKLYIKLLFSSIKQHLSNWLYEFAEFMDPDTIDLFEPINETKVSNVGLSKMAEVFVQVFDIFIPTDLTRKEVLKIYKRNKLKLFNLIREIVEDRGIRIIKECENVDLSNTFFKGNEFILEYIAFTNREVVVRVIGSGNPWKILEEYHSHIKKQFR